MVKIDHLSTETRNQKTLNLDLLTPEEIVTIMNEEDLNVVAAVKEAIPNIVEVIKHTTEVIQNGGRVVWIGAGTSGRMGLIDAVECGPTFGCTTEWVGLLAGGLSAVVKAKEGAEDDAELGKHDVIEIGLTEKDMVIGIAASGRTPYCIGAMDYARSIGAITGCVCCNKNTELAKHADYPIEVSAGPEVLTGSTRLKSGTCQKVILNMISTATMVGCGKVFGNLMIDVKATNLKLEERCRRIVMNATDCTYQQADEALKETNNDCKTATVMILLGVSKQEAEERLSNAKGMIRTAIQK